MTYHPSYRAVDSVGTECETFEHEYQAVDYWTGAPTGIDIQYWNGSEWEEYNPRTFTKD